MVELGATATTSGAVLKSLSILLLFKSSGRRCRVGLGGPTKLQDGKEKADRHTDSGIKFQESAGGRNKKRGGKRHTFANRPKIKAGRPAVSSVFQWQAVGWTIHGGEIRLNDPARYEGHKRLARQAR